MAPSKDWVVEMTKGNNPSGDREIKEMINQMDRLGLKGAYNPKNVFPGSPFMPSSMPTAKEVQTKSTAMSKKVLADWNTLRKIVERHHDVLEKRWVKKTRTKQKDLLLQAWPNMSPMHRPDFEAYRRENTGRRLQGLSRFQDAYFWPYINLQDLSTKSLLIFIKSRARNPPSAFARADVDATNLGSVGHQIPEPAFLKNYTLFMDGDNVKTYGKLVSWADDPDAVNLMFSQRQFTPGDGLRVLEIQSRTYPFLIKCCELILHDLKGSGTLFDDRYPILPEVSPPMDAISTTKEEPLPEILPTLASMTIEAPYRLPASLDLDRIRGILSAKCSASADHLWALREDPGYFADTVKDWGVHRNDSLPDTMGNPHPTGPHTTDFWERVIRNVIAVAYSDYMTWHMLLQIINRLCKLQKKYEKDILYDTQLPKEYLLCLLHFRQMLTASCENPLFYLKNIQSSPPLRQYFIREPQQPGTINMYIRPINELDPFFHKPWGLLLILWDEEQRKLFGLTNTIDAFEQLMQDPLEKKNLSPYMADLFADLGILSRVLRELELYQPWAATFDDEFEDHRKEMLDMFYKDAKSSMDLMDQFDMVLKGIVPLAMPQDGKFDYPTDKKRTKQATEAMIKAEQNLDLFWSKFDLSWKKLTKKTIIATMAEHAPPHAGQKLERTAPWVEPIKEAAPKEELKEPKQPTSTSDEKLPVSSKQKQKTRGITHIPANKATTPPAPTTQPDTQPTFKVSPTALKVFRTLFHTPRQTDRPGEIPWIDFLHAMASTGFSSQKLYGSIWQFTPTRLDVERSIQFHEPHPSVKVGYTVARRMGRRLNRAYGWEGGMFVLE